MSDEIERKRNGQFARGQSGNAAGARVRRPKKLLTYEDVARTILEVASSKRDVRIRGKTERITVLAAQVHAMASGKPPDRLAARDMIELTKSAASHIDRLEQQRAEAKRKDEARDRRS